MRRHATIAGLLVIVLGMEAQQPPVIDMHLHAEPVNMPERTGLPKRFAGLEPAVTDADLFSATLRAMNDHNIVKAVVSGPLDYVKKWKDAAPDRFIAGPVFPFPEMAPMPDISLLRRNYQSGRLGALGEIGAAWAGLAPNADVLKPYFALAEEMDVPVGFHTGGVPPSAREHCCPQADSALGNPALLDETLARYPKLRLYLMHAGLEFQRETIMLMLKHPGVYADLSLQNWFWRRERFHENLKKLMEAGLGHRLMFGSDQMVWPEAIGAGIEGINSAPFLTETQKRDILYNNAARFLRLKP